MDAKRAAAYFARAYLRHFPIDAGKNMVWEKLLRPYLTWRDLSFDVLTQAGITLHVNTTDLIQRMIFYFGVWEPAATAHITAWLRPGDVFIDVGANIGYYTTLASKLVGPTGRVYAFEPSPSIHRTLQEHLALNHCDNVVAFEAGIYHEEATLPLFLAASDNIGASTLMPGVAGERDTVIEGMVKVGPLQLFVPEADILRARMIKIDVEGGEWSVLRGIAALLPRLQSGAEIMVEITPSALEEAGSSVAECMDLFAAAGFDAFCYDRQLEQYEHRFASLLGKFSAELEKMPDTIPSVVDVVFRKR